MGKLFKFRRTTLFLKIGDSFKPTFHAAVVSSNKEILKSCLYKITAKYKTTG